MNWDRARIEQSLDAILRKVFGADPGEIQENQTFGADLMAESLDYLDIELHISQAFEIDFDFEETAERIACGGVGKLRIRDLVDHLHGQLVDD